MSVCLRLAAVAPLRAARFSPCPRGTSEKWHRGLCLLAKAKRDLAGICPGSFSGEAEQTSPGQGWGCNTLLLGVLGAPKGAAAAPQRLEPAVRGGGVGELVCACREALLERAEGWSSAARKEQPLAGSRG